MILGLLRRLFSPAKWTGTHYKGVVVFQWLAESERDYERLLDIENTINQGLGPIGMVDGHDIGAGEMNVFIFTNDAKATFEKTMSLIQDNHDLKELMVGYRKFEDSDYTPMFPPDLECFRVS